MIFNRFTKIKAVLSGLLLLGFLFVKAQNTNIQSAPSHYRNGEEAEAADEQHAAKFDSLHIMEAVQRVTGASVADMNLFSAYYADTLSSDRQAFINETHNSVLTALSLKQFAVERKQKYIVLYQKLQAIAKEFPSTIDEYTNHRHSKLIASIPPGNCNPACTNIGFETGNLSGWSAYDAQNNSPPLTMSYTNVLGGACGAVTKAAIDIVKNKYKADTTYQVVITSGAGNDPIGGPLIPVVAPGGGNYSCRLGDSSVGGSRVGILQQTFSVTATNDNFTYQYAVLIDQATHSYGEQPYFSVLITDQTKGDTLPCGVYLVTSGGQAPKGFDSVQYKIPSYGWTDWIYYRPWQSVFVPLQNYIGDCISVQVTVSDCYPTAIGPHFCYAYFDASCGPLGIISSGSICGGDTLTAPAGGTYVWAGPCISGSNTNQQAFVTCSGTYTVTITSPDGCSDTLQKTVTVSPPITLATSVTNAGCNTQGSAKVTVTGGTGPFTYLWTPGLQTNATATGLSPGSYTIAVADKNGCTATASVTITGASGMTISIATDSTNCNQANGSATATVSGGTAPYIYSWNPSAQTNATATGLGVGTYTVTVTDKNGCTETASVTVNSLNGETAIMGTITNTSCNGVSNGSAMVNVTGGVTPYVYLWSPTGQTNATATGLSAGSYTVTVTDANGCKSSAIGTVTQPSPIVVNSTNQTITCFGQSATLTASATGGAGGPYTYVWMPGAITGSSIAVSPPNSTNYTVIATDANGCTGSAIVSVTVAQSAMLTVTPALSICQGSSVLLIANGAPGTYTWQPGNLSGTSITVTPTTTTTYTVSLTNNCGTLTDTVTVFVSPNPTVRFISDILQGCAPLCVQFRDETLGNISQWNWNFGNGATSDQEDPAYCFKNPGQYDVSLTTTTNIGCSSTLKIQNMITVFNSPNAAFSYSPEPATIMEPTVQFINLSTDAYGIVYWFWTFGDSSDSTSTLENPEHTYQDTGDYCANLIVMNEHGCTDTATDCLPLEPFPTLYIPSAFTPNADGLNDVFIPKGTYIKSFEMYIFDRWGMQLYHTNSIEKGWDGTVGGGSQIAQEDIYVYVIYVIDDLNKSHKYIGRVTLLK